MNSINFHFVRKRWKIDWVQLKDLLSHGLTGNGSWSGARRRAEKSLVIIIICLVIVEKGQKCNEMSMIIKDRYHLMKNELIILKWKVASPNSGRCENFSSWNFNIYNVFIEMIQFLNFFTQKKIISTYPYRKTCFSNVDSAIEFFSVSFSKN